MLNSIVPVLFHVQAFPLYHLAVKMLCWMLYTMLGQLGLLLSQFPIQVCTIFSIYSVTVDASSIQFQYYTSGIYCDTSCSQSNLNHAMLVVGYGTDSSSGVDYWILKNR